MANWTPEQWNTFFIFAGGFVIMIGTQVTNAVISIRNGRKTDAAATKIDDNTALTKQTQVSTDGMKDHLVALAAAAAFTAGQKDQVERQSDIQVAVDAKTAPLAKPPEKP